MGGGRSRRIPPDIAAGEWTVFKLSHCSPKKGGTSIIIRVYKTNFKIMFQTAINLTDTPKKEYNGWSDWTTWNCALWIGGDEGFYNLAKDYRNYGDFVNCIKEIYMDKTPDGAKWDEADYTEMQEMMDEL